MSIEIQKHSARSHAAKKTDGVVDRFVLPAPDAAGYVDFSGDRWFAVSGAETLPEFFTMPVSSSDHWMFVSSRGAISAGRRNPDTALFPYYSCDKLLDTADSVGPLTIVRVKNADGSVSLWSPFNRDRFTKRLPSTVYKNIASNKLLFEEVNESLGLVFRYRWAFGEKFGFIRSCELINRGSQSREISLIDGLQNILPARLSSEFQMRYSSLGDAYKKHEKIQNSRLCLYYLSSIPTDEAMPNEGLQATTAWSTGLDGAKVLLSSDQVGHFIDSGRVIEETDKRGCRGAYLIQANTHIEARKTLTWQIVAEVQQEHADVIRLERLLQHHNHEALGELLAEDVGECQHRLDQIVSSADGLQTGQDQRRVHRHRSNVMYNVMRGGMPAKDYQVQLRDFVGYLSDRNKDTFRQFGPSIQQWGDEITLEGLLANITATKDKDLIRLGREYLPFTFGRRHGDPSRPWNRFSIQMKDAEGNPRIAYEGNWRDIFQNWEAVAMAWPQYTNSIVRKFVNASTADGYNPYRINQSGIDWEVPSDDEFSNIGYWGDHQIIYLSKLLEWSRQIDPTGAHNLLEDVNCAYANVPYRIASYAAMLQDASNTIEFDSELNKQIESLEVTLGTDARLHLTNDGKVHHVSMIEKLLLPAMVKMTNFVPGGGIWLNTQRPEWNDANNALVGGGVSMVTACYLHRFFDELKMWFQSYRDQRPYREFQITRNVWALITEVCEILVETQGQQGQAISDCQRKIIVDQLSAAGSRYRESLYRDGVDQKTVTVDLSQCLQVIDQCLKSIHDCIQQNCRQDGLYHAYWLLHFSGDQLSLEPLDEMLEGQVAAISSRVLSSQQCLQVLTSLRTSRLYRDDQRSYLLYPNRQLATFMEKNQLDVSVLERSKLLETLVAENNQSIVRMNLNGSLNFNGHLSNSRDVSLALDRLVLRRPKLAALVDRERDMIKELFETTFGHHQFTGRSGTFFAYEGLGSIYWHMVSKLSLAVAEQYVTESRGNKDQQVLGQLSAHYRHLLDGIGASKTVQEHGGFPIDPYSHTPEQSGARQPGMTGQVKEDVVARMLELGARVVDGCVAFEPGLFNADEMATTETDFQFVDLRGRTQFRQSPQGSFIWTWCQTPILYRAADTKHLKIRFASGQIVERNKLELTPAESRQLFDRAGEIQQIEVSFPI